MTSISELEDKVTLVGCITVLTKLFDSNKLIRAFWFGISVNRLIFQSPHKTRKQPFLVILITVTSNNSRKVSALLIVDLYIQTTIMFRSTSSIAEILNTL
jgi:hypothetical protein